MLSTVISKKIKIQNGALVVGGQPVRRFKILRELGRGASGIVFEAERSWLAQPCALKIWHKLRANDRRDKIRQGMSEARKIADSDPDWVPHIYDADVINNTFVVSMELISGETLKQLLSRQHDKPALWHIARAYISGVAATSKPHVVHGDPHDRNVMSYLHTPSRFEQYSRLKFIDFGTSTFINPRRSRDRHWNIVDRTFRRILKPFSTLSEWLELHGAAERRTEELRVPYYYDVLDGLRLEAGLQETQHGI